MSEIQVFKNEVFGEIRVVDQNGEPWFIAKDVATALGYENPRKAVRDHCKHVKLLKSNESELFTISPRGMNIISEQDVYRLIMRSNLPTAVKFQDWVCEDVLPSIRKTGGFVQQDREEEFIEKYFPSFTEEVKLLMMKDILASRKKLEQKIEKDEPLVTFAQTCLKSKDNILVRELAKIAQDQHIDIGEKKLYKKLREWKYILKDKTEPSQMVMNLGYFFVEENNVDTAYGVKLVTTTKVTPKGQVAIIQKLKKEYGV